MIDFHNKLLVIKENIVAAYKTLYNVIVSDIIVYPLQNEKNYTWNNFSVVRDSNLTFERELQIIKNDISQSSNL